MSKAPPTKLDNLRKQRFEPGTSEARVSKALAALDARPALRLTPDEWEEAAESPEFEEEE
jgi:hypothetical protein